MRFVVAVPYFDRGYESAEVWVGSIEAASLPDAQTVAFELASDKRKLMDLIIGRDVYLDSYPELADAPDDKLEDGYGVNFGEPVVFVAGDAPDFQAEVERAQSEASDCGRRGSTESP